MSNVWQIGQETDASKLYNDCKKMSFWGEIGAVRILTNMCNRMTAEFEEITKDENAYLVELDDIKNNIDSAQSELEEKIAQIKAEIAELEKKYDNGTITDEELEELKQKKNELNNLVSEGNSNINSMNDEAASKGNEVIKKHESKVKVAEDYGKVTVEKGTPLAETKVKGGFFRKLLGKTGRDKKRTGERAVKVGNELVDKVNDSKTVEKTIKKGIK